MEKCSRLDRSKIIRVIINVVVSATNTSFKLLYFKILTILSKPNNDL